MRIDQGMSSLGPAWEALMRWRAGEDRSYTSAYEERHVEIIVHCDGIDYPDEIPGLDSGEGVARLTYTISMSWVSDYPDLPANMNGGTAKEITIEGGDEHTLEDVAAVAMAEFKRLQKEERD